MAPLCIRTPDGSAFDSGNFEAPPVSAPGHFRGFILYQRV